MSSTVSVLPLVFAAALGTAVSTAQATDQHQHDFDFFYGDWTIKNRKLLHRLQNDNQWEEFEAHQRCWPILGGVGNMYEFVSEQKTGYIGMSLRLFDKTTQQWAIYWMDTSGVLQLPVYGRFEGTRGQFEADDEYAGKPIRVRYLWTADNADAPRWEQAFSADGGKTWETNWIMDFTRVKKSTVAP